MQVVQVEELRQDVLTLNYVLGIGVKKVVLLRSVFDVLTKGHVRIRDFLFGVDGLVVPDGSGWWPRCPVIGVVHELHFHFFIHQTHQTPGQERS